MPVSPYALLPPLSSPELEAFLALRKAVPNAFRPAGCGFLGLRRGRLNMVEPDIAVSSDWRKRGFDNGLL
jgi:hypothetical protein